MGALEQRCGTLLSWLRNGSPRGSTYLALDPARVHPRPSEQAFASRAHYFKVRVHEMRLSHRRRWFATYDPLVVTTTGFRYDGEPRTVPFTIGPALLHEHVSDVPGGFRFGDITVAGPHPYQGGVLEVTLVLYRLRADHAVRRLLSMVDSCSRLADVTASIGTHLKVASLVLDGLDHVLGLEESVPLLGHRIELDPVDGFTAGHHVLALEGELDPETLWVRDNRLLRGRTEDDARPVDDADYVLYSVAQDVERNDVEQLPWFRPLWARVVREAGVPSEDAWRGAKAHMAVLAEMLELSPDLTRDQARRLREELVVDLRHLHDRALELAELGPADENGEFGALRRHTVEILDL
ncbi:hypothetical protein [Actinophytocola xanthii]|uniref:Uncharacterized protein n=1 Tax=Actinophytocola xanthii TaxID=1912961 RepID=A0A1Q8CV13_9PSEU|nr:hypothetical protein [Actinophytocola xanthii]OLF18201.1 hypothetical protein BU204_07635 [Actinophytocola xanthii]